MKLGYKLGIGFCIVGAILMTGLSKDIGPVGSIIYIVGAIVLFILGKISQKKNSSKKTIETKPKKHEFIDNFNPTVDYGVIAFNEERNEFRIPLRKFTKMIGQSIYDSNKIFDFELVVDEQVFSETKTKGGITRAIIGSAIDGGVGALVGVATAKKKSVQESKVKNIKINILLDDLSNPVITVPLMVNKLGVLGLKFPPQEAADRIVATLKVIMKRQNQV